MFVQSQWNATDGWLNTGDDLILSQVVTVNQDHLITIGIFVVSPQILASYIRQFNCFIYLQIFHCIASKTYFMFVVG